MDLKDLDNWTDAKLMEELRKANGSTDCQIFDALIVEILIRLLRRSLST